MIEFFIPMILPTKTHQEKKVRVVNGKPSFYEPQELKNVRNKFRTALHQFVPATPMNGAIRLHTKWCFPILAQHYDGEYKITKPDTDNLIKMLKDVMTELKYWNDDAQVACDIIEKFWANIPGLYVCIDCLEGLHV